jgi:hypothetical protein
MYSFLSDLIFSRNKTKNKVFGSIEKNEEDEIFLQKNKDRLQRLEIARRKKLVIYLKRKKIGIPAAVVMTPITGYIDYLLLMFQRGSDESLAGLTFLMMSGIYWWVTQPKRQYAKTYKKEFLPDIAKLFGNINYKADGKIDMHFLKPSKIIPNHDEYIAEDYFLGEYKGIELEFSEIKLKKEKGRPRRKYDLTDATVFSGLAILLTIKNKRFYGHTILEKNKSALSEWLREKSTGLERAEMSDPEFEAVFDAYTNDQVEARYLIDPIMIEKLNGLYFEYNGKQMTVAFFDKQMLIMVSSDYNHFEPADIFTPATNPDSIIRMRHEVGQILSIIDRLSLYDPKSIRAEQAKASA